MTNRISDLNAFLFAQLERLDVEAMTPEKIDAECKRTDAIVAVADKVAGNYDLQLRAAKLYAEHREVVLPHLPMIGKSNGNGHAEG